MTPTLPLAIVNVFLIDIYPLKIPSVTLAPWNVAVVGNNVVGSSLKLLIPAVIFFSATLNL